MCGWPDRIAPALALALALVLVLAPAMVVPAALRAETGGIGQPADAALVRKLDRDVRFDGAGLPPGAGDVATGEALYVEKCAACHGEFGEGAGRMPALMGGEGTLTSAQPRRTVGSFWPHAPSVFDYVWRAMPFGQPYSLKPEEVYALTAYILHMNDIVPADFTASARTLAAVRMPNAQGFLMPPHPPAQGARCMHDCRESPRIIMRAMRGAEGPGVELPERKPGETENR